MCSAAAVSRAHTRTHPSSPAVTRTRLPRARPYTPSGCATTAHWRASVLRSQHSTRPLLPRPATMLASSQARLVTVHTLRCLLHWSRASLGSPSRQPQPSLVTSRCWVILSVSAAQPRHTSRTWRRSTEVRLPRMGSSTESMPRLCRGRSGEVTL